MDKRHTQEFKEQAVALAKGSEKSVSSIAQDLGIHPQTLRYWIDHPPKDKNGKPAVQVDGNDSVALRLQLTEAREKIRVLEMEKDILKKATAYFAKESQ